MSLPISGPFIRTVNRADTFLYITGYRQRKPYDRPLVYQRDQKSLVSRQSIRTGFSSESTPGTGASGSISQPYTIRLGWAPADAKVNSAVDLARSRFVSKMRGDTAEIAVALAERKQAVAMMTSRVIQLYRFTKLLRQFRFAEAGRMLGVQVSPKQLGKMNLRKSSKAFANNYLEFHFGWSPLIADIGNVAKILGSDVPMFTIKGGARDTLKTLQNNNSGWPYYNVDLITHDLKVRSVVQADVRVVNPNVFLAASLGITNPAIVAWELVPFSFVVDWFVNVSDFLSQYTEFHGTEVSNAFYTAHTTDNYYHLKTWPKASGGPQSQSTYMISNSTRRTLGLPSVTLGVRRPWTLSVRRGLAAISLLIQQGLRK